MSKTVTLTRPAPYICEGAVLLPGENTIAPDVLARLIANPAVARDINAGILVIGHGSADRTEPDVHELRVLAMGDKRKKVTQDAIAKLEEMGLS